MIDYIQIGAFCKAKLNANGYNKPYIKMFLTFLFVIVNLI